MVDPHGYLFQRADHALDLYGGPRMEGARQTVLDAASSAEPAAGVGEPVTVGLPASANWVP